MSCAECIPSDARTIGLQFFLTFNDLRGSANVCADRTEWQLERKMPRRKIYGFADLVCIRSAAEFCARTCIFAMANSAEQNPYARATPMAREARVVETINKIIGGLSSSIAFPARIIGSNSFTEKRGSKSAGLHSTEFLPCAPVCST